MRKSAVLFALVVTIQFYGFAQVRLVPAGIDENSGCTDNYWDDNIAFNQGPAASGIDVDIENAPLFGIEITGLQYDPIPGGFKNLRYRIKNNSEKRIIAIQLWVEVSDGVNVNRTPQFMDWWARQELGLPPAGSAPGPQGLWIASSGGGVRTLKISFGAAIFADGTMIGQNAAEFKKFLAADHQKMVERVTFVGNLLNSKGINSVRNALQEPVSSIAERHTNAVLKEALDQGGAAAFQAEIKRLLSLEP
ncbi:MAG TPA: hypothetical protein VN577_19630 [Terriglobales bacterium]|nr:hypothetical protein [Terriglobales bacterium]